MSRAASSDMARLKRAIERQSGSARTLAHAMRSHAENSPLLGDRQRKVVLDWSETILGISEELTRAMAAHDQSGVRWYTRSLRSLVGPLAVFSAGVASAAVGGAVEGTSSAIAQNILSDQVVAEAHGVMQECAAVEQALGPDLDGASLGATLREYRSALSISQQELARRVGISRSTLSKIERDRPGDARPLFMIRHYLEQTDHIGVTARHARAIVQSIEDRVGLD